MKPSAPLDEAVDRLYALPLDEFVGARNDLAKQLRGDDGRAIRALVKPNLSAWALNQVYWSARPVFDGLVAAAARLREAQASGLQGKGGDLRGAGAAHRDALLAAIREAAGFLEEAGHEVTSDVLRSLTAALEAMPWEERPGRLVRPPEPSGFAVFAGMSWGGAPARASAPARVGGAPRSEAEPPGRRARRREAGQPAKEPKRRAGGEAASEAQRREEREREERKREEREREEGARRERERLQAARREAEAAAERARVAGERLARAREDEQSARERLEEARRTLKDADGAFRKAERAAADAQAALRGVSSLES